MLKAGTVHNGKYLVLVGGQVADVEESLAAGREVGGPAVLDVVFLPHVHPEVVGAIGGARAPAATDALGIVETTTVAAAILAADAGVKGARVRLVELRLADGLGGKGLLVVQPLDESLKPEGRPQVAADATAQAGPGELVFVVASREAAQALPEVFVPVDLAITGLVDEVALENGPRRQQPTARWRSPTSKD